MRILLLLCVLVGWAASQNVCQSLCDGDDSSKAVDPRSTYTASINGREVVLMISDDTNVGFGIITNGQPGDQVWIDRSWDGAWTWSGSNLGIAEVLNGRTQAVTTVDNVDGDITQQKIGSLRVCGKAVVGGGSVSACSMATRSKKLASTSAQAAATALMQYYSNLGSWLTVGWWNSANCLTAMMNYQRVTKDTTYAFIIDTTYEKNKKGNDFITDSVDDTAWWGLVWAQAYQLTGDNKYLDNAKKINDYLQTFTTDKCGGGIVWSAASQYKNAITNELFFKLSAVLHNTIPGDTKYLGWARDYFDWFVQSGMINGNNLINDGLTDNCENNKQTVWTYNQGVILGAAAELYKATKDQAYLDTAVKIADAVIASPDLSPDGILHETCERNGGSCDRDATVFKGVFARNLAELNSVLPNKPYYDYISRNAQKITENGNSLNQYGLHYDGPFEKFTASTQQSALDMIVASAELNS